MYKALVELLKRFHEDWINGEIDKSGVFVVRYDRMMSNFEELMEDILVFIDKNPSDELMKKLKKQQNPNAAIKANNL